MKAPAWWTPPTFRYEGRRWTDQVDGRFDRVRRVALALWPFAAFLSALAVVAASMVAIVNIADQRDRLVATGRSAAAAAREAKAASEASRVVGEGNAALLAELKPCNDGDDPATPGCLRRARTEALVADLVAKVNADLARGLAAHDLNTHRSLEELRRRMAGRSTPLPAPVSPALPIPPPAVSAAPGPPVATPPATSPPSTPPAPCPTLPNGKCRR